MEWRKSSIILLAVALATVPTTTAIDAPLTGEEVETGTCEPASDGTALEGTEFYVRIRDAPGKVVELWQETNDLDGLQYSSGMACGNTADHLVLAQCVNTICMTF